VSHTLEQFFTLCCTVVIKYRARYRDRGAAEAWAREVRLADSNVYVQRESGATRGRLPHPLSSFIVLWSVVFPFAAGMLRAQSPPAVSTTHSYDNSGHLVKVDYGATGVILYSYDPSGNLVARQVQPAATPRSDGPLINNVLNAEGGGQAIAPNSWVAIYGTNLAPPGHSRAWTVDDFHDNQLPVQLDGISVEVHGKSAFVYYIRPSQVNILTPPDPMQGTVRVTLTNGTTVSPAYGAQAQKIAPSFFTFGGSYVSAVHLSAALVGPRTLYPGTSTPASPGETILLFGNGFGIVSTLVTNSSPTQSGSLSSFPVITIGGITATVQFAGLISPGLYQFNVIVPSGVANGDNLVVASHDGLPTQPGVVIAVER
jgi:uncharacterized protein (TIGR03437 family)